MDLTPYGLTQAPIVEKAFEALSQSGLSYGTKSVALECAQVLKTNCAKAEPELEAAALLQFFKPGPHTADDLTPRVAELMNIMTTSRPEYQDVENFEKNGVPHANDLRILHMASTIGVLDDIAQKVGKLLHETALAAAFGKTARVERTEREVRAFADDIMNDLQKFVPILGKTGEEKLERLFIERYNKLATLAGKPALIHPADLPPPGAAPIPPAPPIKGPTP